MIQSFRQSATPGAQFSNQTNLFILLPIVTGSDVSCIWEKKKEGLEAAKKKYFKRLIFFQKIRTF